MRLPVQKANNNLDAVAFNNQYLLWRSELRLAILRRKKRGSVVLRTSNLKDYTIDTTLCIGNDIREPRFACVNGDSLFLYFFEGGSKKLQVRTQEGLGTG
jgi:hypothetical protein